MSISGSIGMAKLEKEVHFEDVLTLAGGTGWWQLLLISWMSLFFLTVPFTCFSMIFMGETPDYLCADGQPKNATFASLSEAAAERCRAPDGQPCRRWLYDTNFTGSSVVTQWDLVCERRPLLSTIQSVMQFGGLFGSLGAGVLGDRLGRRTVYLAMMTVYVLGALLGSVVSLYEMFLVTRFASGVGWMGVVSTSFVLIVELTGMRWRAWAGQLYMLPNALGQVVLAGVAYKLRVWWQLQLALSLPLLVFVLSWWLVPESPRWLILRGRDDDALKVLATTARVNGHELPDDAQLHRMLKEVRRSELAAEEAAAGGGLCADTVKLWSSRVLRRWMLATIVCWIAVCGAYFGLSFDVTQLSENAYLAGGLSGLVEIPAYFMAPFLDRFGRRPVASGTFFFAGVSMMLILVEDQPKLWLVAGLSGKLFISCVYAMIFVYTPEYIPTSVRTVGFGIANVCSRFGSMTAPYVVDLTHDIHRAAPSVVFGSGCLLASLAVLLLPETAGRPLPETVEEVEAGVLDERLDRAKDSLDNPDGQGMSSDAPGGLVNESFVGGPTGDDEERTISNL
ncbi:organic cation transporter protein-like [Amphibalanus amphitrite]|uniref:organic cation transporter protein-like n=1 Tax=Amphibalanus amphitrite TaxID=1232801 RepID=UPI001C928582|nr:organic cation transporter protein-like [Amphibalanus amphitrite]